MQSKSLLIAIAAFAVTATGVQAYGGADMLQKAGLTEDQISAFEVAREKRQSGDLEGARNTLVKAGVDENVLKAMHKASKESRDAIRQAVEKEDYEAFKTAVVGTPLADSVDTEADFKLFVQAHLLKEDGKWDEAKKILDELGVKPPQRHFGMGNHHGMKMGAQFQDLTDAQRQALQAAHKANDKEAEKAILEEAGITMPGHRMGNR
jgi:hypothetical protein